MTEYEFLLEDRLAKIKSVINQYGLENFYISFSGGKDSTVLHNLIDIAIPDNKIPRVYVNTGIDLNMIRDFVFGLSGQDNRINIITPHVNIKTTLDREGYPFKSKLHSKFVDYYQRNGKTETYYSYLGLNNKWGKKLQCPKILKYQFTDEFKLKISYKCCLNLKEKPLICWSRDNKRPFCINGIMQDEGGRRVAAKCLAFSGDKLKAFQPLVPLSKDWENWFISAYNIKICDIYKPPFNFDRTGCKGCPFSLNLQNELDVLQRFFPNERKQCEYIWKPVYDEYRRIGYRLNQDVVYPGQLSFFDFL